MAKETHLHGVLVREGRTVSERRLEEYRQCLLSYAKHCGEEPVSGLSFKQISGEPGTVDPRHFLAMEIVGERCSARRG